MIRESKIPLIKPVRLKTGDTIGIVSPSWCGAGLVPHRLERGIQTLKKMGYRIVVGNNARLVTGHTAGSPKQRASDLNHFFADKRIKAIISAIGGNHSNQILEFLDWKTINENPKIFIGFSDITVLHLAIYTKTGITTFYGPSLLNQFAEYPKIIEYTKKCFLKAVAVDNPVGKIEAAPYYTDEVLNWFEKKDLTRARGMNKNKGWAWLRPGVAQGKLLGGCISSLMHLRGTEFWPSFKNSIFFWEIPEGETIYNGETPETIDSYLTDLELNGVFNEITGMIVGRPYRYSKGQLFLLKKIILARTKKYNFPILLNADFGHTDPMITIPIGVQASLDSAKNEFIIKDSGVV